MNLRSLLNKKYQLQKISVDNGFLQILTDKNGNSSLKILKSKETKSTINANINSFELTNITVFTKSINSKTNSITEVKKANFSGSFAQSNFTINLKSDGLIKMLDFKGEHISPMQKYECDISLDKKENTYTINKGVVSISNIPMRVVGSIDIKDNTLIDLVFSANDISLKQVDTSLLSGLIGKTGYEPRGGNLYLQSTIKGYIKNGSPAINSSFKISDGKIFDRNKKINYKHIYISGNASNGKNQHITKSTSVQIDTFSIQTDKSMQTGTINIKNLSNPEIIATIKGEIAVEDINIFTSIPQIKLLNGTLTNNLTITGQLTKKDSTQPNKQDKLLVKGEVYVKNLSLQVEKFNFPDIQINGLITLKDKHSYKFDSVACKAASSDITINGLLSNINASYRTPIFSGSIHSKMLNISDFKSSQENSQQRVTNIIFPDSIEVVGNISIDKLQYSNFKPKNISSAITYKRKTLSFNNLNMQVFSGSVDGNVYFQQNTTTDIYMEAKANLKQNNIEQMFSGFNNFGQKIISSENLNGTISGNINYSSVWSNALLIDFKSINSLGNLHIKNGELKNYEPLLGLSKFIDVEELKHIKFENLETTVTIHNRQILLDQTNIKSSAISFEGSGIHDFDNKYEYRLQLGLSDVLWRKARKKKTEITEFGYIVDDGAGHTIVPVIITGIGTTYNVKFDKRTSRSRFKEKLEEEKKELKGLFTTEPKTIESNQDNSPALEEEKKPTLEKTNSGTYRNQTNSFILDWDDGEAGD
jgi:hypothetical protein